MRGGAISCIFFALLCGCRPASPAVAGAVLSSGGVRPARPLGCHPLILAKADVEDLKAGGDGGRDDEQWITGPIQILFRVGKEAAAKLGEAMKGGALSEQEKAARDAENELIRKILKQYELNKMLHRAADKGYAAEIERLVRPAPARPRTRPQPTRRGAARGATMVPDPAPGLARCARARTRTRGTTSTGTACRR